MNWRTEVHVARSENKIDHRSRVMFMGSCFAEHFYGIMQRLQFQVNDAAHGIIFHPTPIHKALHRIADLENYTSSDWLVSGNLFVSPYHHGRYNNANRDLAIARVNAELETAHDFLKRADFLFITYGTARGYRHHERNEIFANCHKLPQSNFSKALSAADELLDEARTCFKNILKVNPKLKIVCTVSPVRHWKDGAVANQRSKSILHSLCGALEDEFEAVSYFPAYEIMMDDLRDYRFYKDDLIHPSDAAIRYISEKFFEAYLSENAKGCNAELGPVLARLEHKGLHETPEDTEKRKAESHDAIRLIIRKYYSA